MQLPIDSGAIRFISDGAAKPLVDFETKVPRIDETGRPLFTVGLFVSAKDSRDTIEVKIAGEPKGLGDVQLVRVTGLVATTWTMGDRHGVSFRAERIEPLSKVQA
jgi:hypothetical protein